MTDLTIDGVFDLLDRWRHFPNYQLERRADIYFAMFLPDVLEAHYHTEFNREVVPEFPLRKGTLWPDKKLSDPNGSKKVDYVALTKEGQVVFFVELKTDIQSRNPEQDGDLEQAKDMEFSKLVDGILKISNPNVTGEARKYVHLLKLLSKLNLVDVPDEVYKKASNKTLHGLPAALSRVKNKAERVGKPKTVYIQPKYDQATHKGYADYIYFEEFANAIKGRGEIANRFALSLLEWAEVDAGSAPPGAKCP